MTYRENYNHILSLAYDINDLLDEKQDEIIAKNGLIIDFIEMILDKNGDLE